MRGYWFLLLLILASTTSLKAQFDVNAYLGSYTSDFELRSIKNQRDFVNSTNFNSPIIRELEFRMRAPQFTESPDDFRLRFSPINPWERKANKEYTSVLNKQMETQEQVYFAQVLTARYQFIINLFFAEKYIESYSRTNDEYSDLINVFTQQVGASRDIIRLKKQIFQSELKMEQLEGQRASVVHLISVGKGLSNELSLENFNMVTVDQIRNELLRESQTQMSILEQNERNKLLLSEFEWKINKTESFSNLGFLQAEYRSNRGETLNENLGWQVGFQIPIFNKDNPDLQRRKLDLIEDELDVKRVKEEVDLTIFKYRNTLETLLKQYDLVESEIQTLDSDFGSSDTETLLELAEYKSDLELQQLEINQEILMNYIYWLNATDQLLGDPLLNQLSETKTLINTQ